VRAVLLILMLLVAALSQLGGGGVLPLPGPSVTAVVYVYEKDQHAVPSAVMAGLNRLNREKKITATIFDRDTTDGGGQVPDQYKAPLAAAVESGVPSLVVMGGDTVWRVVKDPKTEAAVMEAVN